MGICIYPHTGFHVNPFICMLVVCYFSLKNAEVNQDRQDLETFKRSLERQVKELEEELDTQRRELTAGVFSCI